MPRRSQERKAQWETFCKRGIAEAAVRLLAREGSEGFTMDKVAAEAGVAKGTLYVYFKDKRCLLQHVKETTFQPLREEIAALLSGDLPPASKVEKMIRRHVAYFDEHRELLRVLLWQRQIAESHIKRQASDPYRALLARVAAVIEEGISQGAFRPLDPSRAASILVESSIATALHRLRQERPSPLEEDIHVLLEVVLRGLEAPGQAAKAAHPRKGDP